MTQSLTLKMCIMFRVTLRFTPALNRWQFNRSRFRLPIARILDEGMSHQSNNICAGTQVASPGEVHDTTNSLVHPLGAVGVVTRTVTGDQNQFLARFPGGFKSSLTREQRRII